MGALTISRMHPLGRLIAERRRIEGWSMQAVVDRAAALGEALGKSNLARLEAEPPLAITRKTVLGLASGLGVTPLTVANAVLESWGIETRPVEVTDSLATIAIDPSLSDRHRRQLRALIVEMRSARPAAGQDGEDWSAGWGGAGDQDPGMGGDQEGEKGDDLRRG
jgi:hypothetical protein